MPRHDFEKVSLYAYHEPDAATADRVEGSNEGGPGAGHIHFGLELDGVRLELGSVKAGRYLRNRARHEIAQAEG